LIAKKGAVMTPPKGIDLNQYKTQAKELLKQARAALPEALDRLRQHHPEHDSLAKSGSLRLADTQLVIARENEFPSWSKFKQYLLFRNAVQALDSGDIERLETLLDKHPWLVRYHCQKGECYEEGYFAGATLLNHIAGNPSRCPIPRNILDITRLLLSRGARDESPKPKYTIGLLLTSRQASEAGVALPLIDLLIAAGGIEIDLTHPSILNGPLGNEAPETALALIRRGAKMDIRHAAALGQLDLVKCFFDGDDLHANLSLVPLPEEPGEAKAQLEQAFIWACQCGQNSVSEFLLEQSVDPAAQANVGQTGLHYAAHYGHLETVKMLIARKAPLEVKNMYGGTVLGQALWSAFNEPQDDHLPIVEALIAAGAKIDPDWNKWIDELRQRHGAKS
jgi:Ankyrin repeats (3 copies)